MEIIACNINEAKKNKIIKLINNSFELEEGNKAEYVNSRLKKYIQMRFGVFFIYVKENLGHILILV